MEKQGVHKWKARMLVGRIKYYLCFCKVALSLAAAICCYSVVNYNVVGLLTTYFTGAFNQDAIHKSAVLVNILGGLQEVVAACMWAYTISSGFRNIIFSGTHLLYTLGLLMLYLSASNRIPKTNFLLYIFVCVLIAVGKVGGSSILKRDLLDQLVAGHENIEQIDWERAWRRRNVWLVLAGVLVVIIPFGEGWSTLFKNSMCIIGAAGFISLATSCLFHRRHLIPPETQTGGEYNLNKDHETLPFDKPLKNWGNRQLKSSSIVNVPNLLLRMIPMWSTFIVFSLVTSTADTFFNMQDDSMMAQVTTSNFLLAKDALKVVAGFLCGKFLEPRRLSLSRSEQNFVLKMIICLGMILSVICSSLASQVEVQRLKTARDMGLVGKSEDDKVPMSDWCMAPLFGLWGIMEGLSIRGLDDFFSYHVSKSMEDCGSEIYNRIPMAMGKLLSAICVSACKGWFGDTLNQSRLDKYYRMITVLAWINLCWFYFVTTFYPTREEEEEEADEVAGLQESKVEVIIVDVS